MTTPGPATPTQARPPRPTALAAGRGFTLIELIAVLAVAAVLAATALPALKSMGASRGRLAAALMARDVTYARERAVATGVRAWVDFSTSAGTWTVLSENPSSPGRSGASAVTDPATGSTLVQRVGTNAFPGIAITSASFDGSPSVGFDWLGRPLNQAESSLAADGSAVLTGSYTVTVRRGTGYVTVSP